MAGRMNPASRAAAHTMTVARTHVTSPLMFGACDTATVTISLISVAISAELPTRALAFLTAI